MTTCKRRAAWACEIIQYVEKYGVLGGTFRESNKSRPYSSYVVLMCNLVDEEPTCFEEAPKKKEWMDSMAEEDHSIAKNYVWDVVLRLKDKIVVS